jgi:hypothetical protein
VQDRTRKRARIKHATSLDERLSANTRELRRQLKLLPPGAGRNQVLRRIMQNEAAAELNQLLAVGSIMRLS